MILDLSYTCMRNMTKVDVLLNAKKYVSSADMGGQNSLPHKCLLCFCFFSLLNSAVDKFMVFALILFAVHLAFAMKDSGIRGCQID